MGDTKQYKSAIEGSMDPYFPPMDQTPDCGYCEKRKECPNANKFQRNRRNFTYTSGRCPRLPDRRGFVDRDEQELYAQTFPLVYAERGAEDTLHLSLSIPGRFNDGKDQAVPVTDMIRALLSGKPMPDGVIPIAPDAAEELWENAATPLANGGLVARVVSGPMKGTTTLTAAQAAEWCEWLTGEPCHNAADGCPENDAV